MAGTVKKLQFSEGTDVGAPTDLGIASSTVVIQPYASDAAYVTANGAASSGSAYLNTALDQFRYYTNGVWHNALNATDATDNTKSVAWDFSGQGTGLKTTFAVAAASSNKTITFPNLTDTVVTRTSADQGASRLQNKDVDDTTFKIVDSSDTTKKIALNAGGTTGTTTTLIAAQTANRDITFPDATTTLVGTDATQTISNKTYASPIVSGGSLDQSAAGSFALLASAGANTISVGGASSTVRIVGNLQVDGTTTTVNSATLEVTDANILVNNGGNDASSEGAGLQVERTGTNGSIIYADAAASKWKAGALGAELEILTTSATQSASNKAITASTIGTTDIDGGTASNTSRITIPKASTATLSGLTRKQGTIVHDTSLNQPFWDDGSALQPFGSGSGSGSGEVNAVLNPSAATNTTGYTAATNYTVARVTSGSPLDPVTTTALSMLTSTASSEASNSGIYYTISTHPTGLRNKKLKVEFYCTVPATADGVWALSVRSGGTTRMSLSTDSSGATVLPGGFTGKFTAYFDADSSTSYTVNFTNTTRTNANTLYVTGLIVGPGIQPQGAVVGDVDVSGITFDGFGTVSATNLVGTRRGNKLHVQAQFRAGTVSANNMRVILPSSLVLDSTKYQASRSSVVGLFSAYRTGATQYPYTDPNTSTMFYDGSNTDSIYITNSTASDNMAKVTGSAVYSNNQYFSFQFEVAVAAWAGAGNNLAQNDVEYAATSGTWDADSSTTIYGPGGALMSGALTDNRQKTVTWQTPASASDVISLEFSSDQIAWYDAASVAPYSANSTGSNALSAGFRFYASSATTIGVRFMRYQTIANDDSPTTDWGSLYWRVKKVKSGQAVGFGLADTAGNAGLVNPYSSSGAGVVYSGSWTATLTNNSNTTSLTWDAGQYTRVGNRVTCFARLQIDPTTAAGTATSVGISLPIASNFTDATADAQGYGSDDSYSGGAINTGRNIVADTTNDRISYRFSCYDTGVATHFISFMYVIK